MIHKSRVQSSCSRHDKKKKDRIKGSYFPSCLLFSVFRVNILLVIRPDIRLWSNDRIYVSSIVEIIHSIKYAP